jgi:hypothetical protein
MRFYSIYGISWSIVVPSSIKPYNSVNFLGQAAHITQNYYEQISVNHASLCTLCM